MKFISFHSSAPVHAAGDDLVPLCKQTDGHKARRVQQLIVDAPTCKRCLAQIKLTESILPCPFCGGPAASDVITGCQGSRVFVGCTKCCAGGPLARARKGAILKWNSRPGISPLVTTPPQAAPRPQKVK